MPAIVSEGLADSSLMSAEPSTDRRTFTLRTLFVGPICVAHLMLSTYSSVSESLSGPNADVAAGQLVFTTPAERVTPREKATTGWALTYLGLSAGERVRWQTMAIPVR